MVKAWDVQTGRELFSFPGHDYCVLKVAFSPDGKHLASLSEGQRVKVWDLHTGQEFLSLGPNEPQVSAFASLAFSPDEWDAQTGQELLTFNGSFGGMAFSPDGKRLTCTGGIIRALDVQTGQLILSIRENISSVAFSPDGQRLASAGKVWDAQTGQELLSLRSGAGNFGSAAFSPDGHRLGIISARGQVTIYDATPLPEKP